MFIRFNENNMDVSDYLTAYPTPMSDQIQEKAPFEAGFGGCKSCNCRGYEPEKPNYCKCGHHFSQHR